jgi:hypothetical protein
MEPKYPKGLLWKMKLIELKVIADAESIPYPEDVKRIDLYKIILDKMPMVGSWVVSPPAAQPDVAPPVADKPVDDSPASARIKRIRQANQ